MPTTDTDSDIAVTSTMEPGAAYLEWGAIFGGSIVAIAISIVLLQFGLATGLAVGEPLLEDGSPSWNVLVAGLWVALVALSSSSVGGYISGRMRSRWGDAIEAEVEFRDGSHGLVVWGVATVAVTLTMALIAALSTAGANGGEVAGDVALTAEQLRRVANVSTIFAFATAAGMALAAAGAWQAATVGGSHRDEGLSIHEIVPRMLRRRRV